MSTGNQMLSKAMKGINMQMNEVKSSNISKVGYNSHDQTLAVTFKDGKTYHYSEVPSDVNRALLEAESVGKFLSANVVGKFKHQLIEE